MNQPIPAYEVTWDGVRYHVTCLACFLECEASSPTPQDAISKLRHVGCGRELRETSLRSAAGWDEEIGV